MTGIVTLVRQQNDPWAMFYFQMGLEPMVTACNKFERTEIAPPKRDYAKWEKGSLGLHVGDQIILRETLIEVRVEDTRVVMTPG